jgi:hypothetical protein
LLERTITRRKMLHITGGALVGILLASCSTGSSGGGDTAVSSAGGATGTTAGPGVAGTHGMVFNTASQDVTLFDPTTNRVTDSRPINAVIRWLSNQQHYWDGESIWTYDFPEVTKQVPVGGAGPGHSFVLSPDNERGFVNSAGSNFLAVVDPTAGEVLERVEMGAFP